MNACTRLRSRDERCGGVSGTTGHKDVIKYGPYVNEWNKLHTEESVETFNVVKD